MPKLSITFSNFGIDEFISAIILLWYSSGVMLLAICAVSSEKNFLRPPPGSGVSIPKLILA